MTSSCRWIHIITFVICKFPCNISATSHPAFCFTFKQAGVTIICFQSPIVDEPCCESSTDLTFKLTTLLQNSHAKQTLNLNLIRKSVNPKFRLSRNNVDGRIRPKLFRNIGKLQGFLISPDVIFFTIIISCTQLRLTAVIIQVMIFIVTNFHCSDDLFLQFMQHSNTLFLLFFNSRFLCIMSFITSLIMSTTGGCSTWTRRLWR